MDWVMWLEWVLKGLILCLILLGGFAYLTLYERRALARMQVRVGPNRAGPQGILQPIADAVKLIFKEEFTPAKVYKVVFILAPVLTVVPSLIIAAVIPLGTSFNLFGREITLYVADVNVGILYVMSIASIAVYGIVLAGWSSNNKYAMLGGIRSSAQMISYELALGFCFVFVILLGNSMSLNEIVDAQKDVWFFWVQPVGAVIFFIVVLAEVNRAPFDMPEAEQELTAGYHAEYSGMKFALFFMAEYQKMIVMSMITATLFFGGYREPVILQNTFLSVDAIWTIGSWTFPAWFLGPMYLFIKVFFILFLMIWVRATWPRLRYDRLMALGWKIFLPLTLALCFITAVGILLSETNPLYYWSIPVLSILSFLISIAVIYRDLTRRKTNARV
ncbi:MAG TPA: NADH-quinone oxidoreductase subunit NuoH [Anaerolineae bacterium]|nr:NADH-quinone oxidoreductase subunit NuoH [Anaerolineae bacterium]HCK67371.1 NADH-quinone oxidoreductase subunit NuoH [Anaerolineae bacterium]